MNEVTLRLLALAAFAGSTSVAFAATLPPASASYNLKAQFTNNAPRLLEISALPKAAAAAPVFKSGGDGVTTTDGAGKIQGVQSVVSDLGGGTQVVFTADITGAIVGRGKTNGDAAVRMTIKGSGALDGLKSRARMNLTFRGATGITPNTQSINTAAPGYNIRLAPDGSTNSVERYDPWSGVEGRVQGWTTFQLEVHSYSISTVYTTNGPDAQPPLLVSNRVNALMQAIDLAGYDHFHQEYVPIKFGTPLKTDRGDGYFGTNSYGCFSMGAGGGTTTVIPLWIIAEEVSAAPAEGESGTTYAYCTNLVYGADIADLGPCLEAYHAVYDTMQSSEGDAAPRVAPRCAANQYQTNYAKSLIVATSTNVTRPTFASVVKGGRCVANCWNSIQGTLDGTISAGKARLVLKKSPASFEESHELWTPIASAPGEESYLIRPVTDNLTVLTNTTLAAAVQQSGRKLALTSDLLNLSFNGSGNLNSQRGVPNSTYTARLSGLGAAKGAALTLKGATRPLITGYEVITNAPPVVKSIVNQAADGAFSFVYTNTTSGRLQVPAKSFTYTSVEDNVVSVVTYSHPALNVDNPCFRTNTVDHAIGSVIVNGKVLGQKWVANTVGFNLDAPYPDPLPVVSAP